MPNHFKRPETYWLTAWVIGVFYRVPETRLPWRRDIIIALKITASTSLHMLRSRITAADKLNYDFRKLLGKRAKKKRVQKKRCKKGDEEKMRSPFMDNQCS